MRCSRKATDDSALPAAIFTDPELAQVGLIEPKARAAYPDVAVRRHDFDHNDRSVTDGDMRGFVKIMARGNRVIGVTIVGAHAEKSPGLAEKCRWQAQPQRYLANRTFAYPTLSEALRFAAELPGQAKLFTPFTAPVDRPFPTLAIRADDVEC